MSHFTTLEQIVTLSEAEQQPLSKTEWTPEDHQRCADIQNALVDLWPIRRAELVRALPGPPRLVSAPDPRSHHQVARFASTDIAHGIAPLPSGGER